MDKVGVLVVSYGAREAAMVDALSRSPNYKVELYIADKQRNPFNVEKATKHVVIPDLNVEAICKFAEVNKTNIDFAIVGPEKPIIEGARRPNRETNRHSCHLPKQEYAIEVSKVQQRLLFQEIAPEANPRFKVFDPKDYKSTQDAKQTSTNGSTNSTTKPSSNPTNQQLERRRSLGRPLQHPRAAF